MLKNSKKGTLGYLIKELLEVDEAKRINPILALKLDCIAILKKEDFKILLDSILASRKRKHEQRKLQLTPVLQLDPQEVETEVYLYNTINDREYYNNIDT